MTKMTWGSVAANDDCANDCDAVADVNDDDDVGCYNDNDDDDQVWGSRHKAIIQQRSDLFDLQSIQVTKLIFSYSFSLQSSSSPSIN